MVLKTTCRLSVTFCQLEVLRLGGPGVKIAGSLKRCLSRIVINENFH